MARSRCGQWMRSPRSFWGWQDPGVGAMRVRGGQGREVWGLAGACLAGCRRSVRGDQRLHGVQCCRHWAVARGSGGAVGCQKVVTGWRRGHGRSGWMRAEDADWRCRHHVAASMPWVVGAMGWQGSACSLLPPILGRARGCCGHPMVGTGAGEPRLSPRTRPLGRDVLDWGLGQFWVCGTVPSGHALWGSDSGCRAVPREGGSPHRRCPEDVPAGRAWHPPPRQGTAPGVLLSSPRPPATSGRHRPPCPCLSPSSRCPHPGGLGAASSRGGHRGLPGQGRDTPPPS